MRDSKEFRERFLRWKNGEKVYDNGRPISSPEYDGGKDSISTFVSQLGPLLYKKLQLRNIDDVDSVYSNMISQLAYESNYGTSRVARELHNYGGYGWNGKTYTTFKNDADFIDHYLNIMTGRHKLSLKAKDPSQFAESLKKSVYYEDTVDNYRRNLLGMVTLRRIANLHRRDNIDLYTSNPIKQEEPILPLIEDVHNSILPLLVPQVEPIITPQSSTRVDLPWRYVEAQKQVDNSAGWKAMNHFLTLDLLKQVMDGYDWQPPELPPLFPLKGNQWTKSLIGYRGGKDGDYIYEGRTLPEVTVYPTTLTLRTHYPIISNYLPGHSELFGYDDSTGRYFSISKRPGNAGYNFITNNCSDDTRKALEAATGNAIRPFLFTTPGDVQDFFRLQYPNSKERWYNGVRTLKANVSLAEFNKAKEIADSLSVVNYEKRRKDAEKWRLEHLKTLSKYIKGKDSLPGYVTGEDGGFLNWLKNAVIGASVADAPAVATASGWHNKDGQWRLNRTAADEDLGRRLVDISMMSPTNPATAALDGAFRLAAKGVKLALPGVKLALYKIHPRVKQNTIDIPEFNFDFPQDNLPELSYDASIDDIILYAADNNTAIDFPTYPELLSKWKSEAINAERRAMDFYKNDVIPRTKNVLDFWIRDFGEIDKPNMNVYYNKFEEYPHDPFHTFAVLHSPKKIIDIGKNESKYLGFANQDGMTIIKQKDWLKDLDDTIVHEGEHALRYNIGIDALISKNRQINDPDTRKIINTLAKSGKVSTVEYAYSPSEIRALDDAYLFTSDFLKENKIHLIAEKGATNRELRYKISKMNNYAVGSDLDAIIDKMSTKDIISLLENGNGYSRNFLLKINNQIDNLVTYNKYSREDAYKEIWNKYRFNIKRALKTVPVGTGVAAAKKKQLK